MNCSGFETILTDYLERRLDSPVRQAVGVHLGDCEQCRALLENVVALRRELEDFPELSPPGDLVDRILVKTTGRPKPLSFWKETILPTMKPFFTKRFAFATVLLFVFLSLMVNLVGPPAGAVLSPGGLAESADRLTSQVAMKWAQVLSFTDSVGGEIRLLREDLYGRLDYHLVSQFFKSYQKSLEEQQNHGADDSEEQKDSPPVRGGSMKGDQ